MVATSTPLPLTGSRLNFLFSRSVFLIFFGGKIGIQLKKKSVAIGWTSTKGSTKFGNSILAYETHETRLTYVTIGKNSMRLSKACNKVTSNKS